MSKGFKHSEKALHAKQIFLESANDFNLYVEDSGYEYWYQQIFNRLGYKLVSVVASGNKNKLREDYYRYGKQEASGQLNFYLTDGDFWRYNNPAEMIRDDCFIYLKTYNIESHFIDEAYSIRFLQGRLQTNNEGVLARGFNFEDWKQRIIDESYEQFFVYATLENLTSMVGEENPKFSHDIGKTVTNAKKFLDKKTGFLDKKAWKSELERLEYILESHNLKDDFAKLKEEIEKRYDEENNKEYYNLICGKYLFMSLFTYIQSIIKSKKGANLAINHKDFKWECINSFNTSELNYIKIIIDAKLRSEIF